MLEIRSNGTLTAKGKTLSGYAAVFNSEANLGDFNEVIKPGAFAKSLATGSNIRALSNHDVHALVGTTKSGTLQLREDAHGLATAIAAMTAHSRCANQARWGRLNAIKTATADASPMPRANVTTESVNVVTD